MLTNSLLCFVAKREDKRRVERGAKLLDMEQPGWETCIDITALNIDKYDCCILGQLYNGYGEGKRLLLNGQQAIAQECGFTTLRMDYSYSPQFLLRALWIREIRKRLAEPCVTPCPEAA